MTGDPIKPLTRAEEEVAECIGKGWSHRRVAEWLGISRSTVAVDVARIAAKLPNPDGLSATHLVMLWAAHRQWLRMHARDKNDAA